MDILNKLKTWAIYNENEMIFQGVHTEKIRIVFKNDSARQSNVWSFAVIDFLNTGMVDVEFTNYETHESISCKRIKIDGCSDLNQIVKICLNKVETAASMVNNAVHN